jgi:hypothetical protein
MRGMLKIKNELVVNELYVPEDILEQCQELGKGKKSR